MPPFVVWFGRSDMRVLLVSPLPRWYLLICKLMAGVFVSLMQVYAFLAIAYAFEIDVPPVGYIAVAPALLLTGMMLGAIGLLLSSLIRQLENFAGVMPKSPPLPMPKARLAATGSPIGRMLRWKRRATARPELH